MKPSGPILPALSTAGGIAVGYLLDSRWWIGIVPIVISISVYFYILVRSGDPVTAFRFGKFHPVWVVLLFCGIGMIDEALSRPMSIEHAYGGSPERIICEVNEIISRDYGDRIDVTIRRTNGTKARIFCGATELSPGDLISLPTDRFTEIAGDTSSMTRRIAPMLKANGILYSARMTNRNIVKVGESKSLSHICLRIRQWIETKIELSRLSQPAAGFLRAILLGDRNGLKEETRMTFANGGLAHVLALSGLHLGILAGFILMLMWPLRLIGRYKLGYVIAILLIWLYVYLTGMAGATMRACIMATLAFIAVILERKNYAGNALAAACLIILIFDPMALFDAGFQLSVVCVGALIAFPSHLNPIRHRQHPVLYSVCGAVIATIIATAASWAIISYYFGQIPLMFLPTNVLLLPLLPLYLCLAIIFVIFLCMGMEVRFLAVFLDKGYDFLVRSAEFLSNGMEFVVEWQIPLWGVCIWLMAISSAAYMLNRNRE